MIRITKTFDEKNSSLFFIFLYLKFLYLKMNVSRLIIFQLTSCARSKLVNDNEDYITP